MKKRAIVWFRNDLRVHDNESLHQALKYTDEILPVYVFDDRVFRSKTSFGFPKTGVHRARFIIDAIHDLRRSLHKIGLPLIIRVGITEDIIYDIAHKTKSSWVFCNRERTQEEVDIQDTLEKKLWTIGQEMLYHRGKMLYHTADLPFPVTHTPDTFTTFRKEVEKIVQVRPPLSVPERQNQNEHLIDQGDIPTLSDLGYSEADIKKATSPRFVGGESAGLERLNYYLWETDLIANYKKTRNGLLGEDYSSKFSPYLAQGCLSPKKIYQELKLYEKERGKNNSTYWMFFELLWRDFFRFMGKKHGNKIFFLSGPKELTKEWKDDTDVFWKWAKGETGIPFVDANMRELNSTGFMSNRGRQVVASFLVNDLHINWLMGAEYFEYLLIDYDPCSNYGNWNYIAGVGSDPRENRYFNILSQARKYDYHGEYIKHMLPELKNIPEEYLFTPSEMTDQEQSCHECKIGIDYPAPMVDPQRWI